MSRDMMKTVENIRGKDVIPAAYDMSSPEMRQLYEKYSSNPFEALSIAFEYGFVLGARAQKNGKLHVK